ncbi:hypothetical protein PVAND_011437 [Polypedilum vanderplanki]|uniref:EF-hand domain-containing protein n=1 Tax=Polypedilum vanderplanki TaxID=319348 RepID=A0A9J6CIL4_POLVA|nr:hypothetical protein PVAND_011437 [Polypedilum vanderplanki]
MLQSSLTEKEQQRYEEIFKKLDKDNNGKIDIHDLSLALSHLSHYSEHYAEHFLKKSDRNESGDVSLQEFIHYLQDHEKNLRLQFSHLDRNKDGKVHLDEMIESFKELGINIDEEEALKLFNRMDKDGSLQISFNDWRDFMLLAPSSDLHELLKYWRHSTFMDRLQQGNYYRSCVVISGDILEDWKYVFRELKTRYIDIGEDFNVPDDFTTTELETGTWWRHLLAGAAAGAASRTCTAPLDRLKVMLQVHHSKQRISDCFRNMLKEGGYSGLWRGNGINVIKIAPESAIKFMVYEQVKRFIRGNDNRPMGIFERFVAGAVAGCVAQTTIYPMEVLKTRLALRKTGQYSSIADAAIKIYSKEGLRSFYRGYIPNILGIIPYAGIDLAVYETLKKKYLSSHTDQEVPQVWLLLACGSASSTLGQLCSYPLALVRTRMQAQTITQTANVSINVAGFSFTQQQKIQSNKEQTMVGVFKKIIQQDGFFGLYRGVVPNFVKVLPAVSISYVVYEFVSNKLGVNMT